MAGYSFVTRVPDEPGILHRLAGIIKQYQGNIVRINYDRQIDPHMVFFEVETTGPAFRRIRDELEATGYLQTALHNPRFLKFSVRLPHETGALFEFLHYTTGANANIAYIDFDEKGSHPDSVTVSLNVDEAEVADELLNEIKSRYHLEILKYDRTGDDLDNTVFYLRFAQQLRSLIGEADEAFVLHFLHDINHIVQELNARGRDPRRVFEAIMQTGWTLNRTLADGFYADIQIFQISDRVVLACYQLPAGGNVFLMKNGGECTMIDTGYGIYHGDVMRMISSTGFANRDQITRMIISHGDADHCGAGGFFDNSALMHHGTLEVIRQNNRAYGSRSEHSVLEEVYTTMIGLFSRCTPPSSIELFGSESLGTRDIFPVIERFQIGDITFEVLESPGGHVYGQVFIYSPSHGILFTGDSLINFESLTQERRDYSSLADFLVTSVNVDSDLARKERQALLRIAAGTGDFPEGIGRKCLVCGGHGSVSILADGKLAVATVPQRYTHADGINHDSLEKMEI
jgi:glyoxylase-like metal-dependent hydrolase (beta-lactamase superfamily II)